jgi:(2Fe-2S) ferredoxin
MALNMGLMERGFQPGDVLITGSTCLGPCELGPTMVVYPDGTWYSQVKESDVPLILDEHIKKGTPVEQMKPDSVWD